MIVRRVVRGVAGTTATLWSMQYELLFTCYWALQRPVHSFSTTGHVGGTTGRILRRRPRWPFFYAARMIQQDSSSSSSSVRGRPIVDPVFGTDAISSWEDGDGDDDDVEESSLSFDPLAENAGLLMEEGNDDGDDFGPAATILEARSHAEQQEEQDETTTEDDALLLAVQQEELRSWQQALVQADESLRRKQESLQKELEKSRQVEQTMRRANLLKSNLYLFNNNNNNPNGRSAVVHDWETGEDVTLDVDDRYYSATEEMEALFGQIRKLKRGANIVEPLLQATDVARSRLLLLQEELDRCSSLLDRADDDSAEPGGDVAVDLALFQLVKDRLVASKDITGFRAPVTAEPSRSAGVNKNSNASSSRTPALGTPASNVRKLTSPAGNTILIGRNRRGNEYLSISYAKNHDVWLHARGTPGAHVVIPRRRGASPLTDACYQMAADLAAFYSDSRTERKVLISVTEAKHLTKPRGAPLGAVSLRAELQVLTGRPEDAPDELKEARAVSGASDEYRAADKAKLRKQNQKQAKQQQQQQKKQSSCKRKTANKARQER